MERAIIMGAVKMTFEEWWEPGNKGQSHRDAWNASAARYAPLVEACEVYCWAPPIAGKSSTACLDAMREALKAVTKCKAVKDDV